MEQLPEDQPKVETNEGTMQIGQSDDIRRSDEPINGKEKEHALKHAPSSICNDDGLITIAGGNAQTVIKKHADSV